MICQLARIVVLLGVLSSCGLAPTAAERPSDRPRSPSPTSAPTNTPTSAPTNTPTSAPTSTQATGAVVAGTIRYPSAPALPPDAVLTVRLVLALRIFYYPGMSQILGEQRISPLPSGAASFAIGYDPAVINPIQPYTVFAEITVGGRRYFSGGEQLDLRDHPPPVAIQLHPGPTATAVTGAVRYPSDRPLPPDAQLTIQLQTPTDGVGAPRVLGEQRVSPAGPAPIPFAIPVDPAALDPYAAYTLFAILEAPGRIAWLADEQPVLTWGAPTSADLTLEPPDDSALLRGLVRWPAPAALPPDAVLSVQIASVSNGTISSVGGGHAIAPVGPSPAAYAIEYTPGSFQPGVSYALYAAVRLHEQLLWSSPLIALDPAALPSTLDLDLQRPTNLATVRGTIRYDWPEPLPAAARIVVQLADTTSVGGDGWPIEIATQTITPTGAQPLSFAIEYDPLTIASNRLYTISAELRTDDEALLRAAPQDVITNGSPDTIELILLPSS